MSPETEERTAIIVQARTGSTRLPEKVLGPLGGRTVLEQVLRRCARVRRADALCVATTELERDDRIVDLADRAGVHVFRGSEVDLLARYAGAARAIDAQLVVRITSDCPLLDPDLIDEMLERRAELAAAGEQIDYYANTLSRTYPRGLDVEIVPSAVLHRVCDEATDQRAREHVTWHLYQHPERFRIVEHADVGTDRSAMRWTLDTPEDRTFVSSVYDELGEDCFDRSSIFKLLERRPDIAAINAGVVQKAV